MNDGSYEIDILRPHLVDCAYLLVQAVVPTLTLAEWQQTVKSFLKLEKVVTATDRQGVVRGLCIYCIRDHEVVGKLLDVPFLVAASAADDEGVARALLNHVKAVANSARCASIRIWTLEPDNWRRMRDPAFFSRWDHGLIMG
ncbi:hypothetical protein SAMN02927900_05980 [Rhizobium mongolense subsp. loessense]|uniref:N-acetyltransferase domain-containing protein n=1 Tax=Rhizobium mongolense subsp. loessense TaxID=158890 RepID=A0A1G4U3U8_9HYPH|nr:hypothetical protein [Rhizobium mongolense]SCW87605.1 hypothetical protein SAMN02927900_05980 [Rhizobium mongolense subsp. loessense]